MNHNKNKRNEADKRKREGEYNLSKLGLSLSSELLSLGIILENLLKSPINEDILNGVNYIFNNFVGVDLNVFAHNMGECCIFLLSPILDLKYLQSWTYPLIVTSTSTLKTAISSKSQNIYCCFKYNEMEKDSRIKVVDSSNLVEIIKVIVEDLKK